MKLTPLKAIKKHCLECSGYEKKEVRECKISDCVLFDYRLGRNGIIISFWFFFSTVISSVMMENSLSKLNFFVTSLNSMIAVSSVTD
ncbi:hypothetical protein M1349_04250 [Patescibacteria group bacterium]|nr:hypothetical protein [Patescibacteria group bacterium]